MNDVKKIIDEIIECMPETFTLFEFRQELSKTAPQLKDFKFGNYLKNHKKLKHLTKFRYAKKNRVKNDTQKQINFIDDSAAAVVPTAESFLKDIPVHIIIKFLQGKKYIILQP